MSQSTTEVEPLFGLYEEANSAWAIRRKANNELVATVLKNPLDIWTLFLVSQAAPWGLPLHEMTEIVAHFAHVKRLEEGVTSA